MNDNDNELNDYSDADNQSQPSVITSHLSHDVEFYEQSILSSVSWGGIDVATESINETVMNFQRKK